MTYHIKHLNPPNAWHSPHLKQLFDALTTYQGQDAYPHPYRHHPTCDIGAAVLVLLTNEAVPRLLLTKRSRHLNAHAGEISFVGGRRDDGDDTMAQTALREAFEEVRLKPEMVSVIGYLPCQTAKSGTLVRPVVAVIESDVADTLVGSEDEIERIFWATLNLFVATSPSEITLTYGNPPIQFNTPAWQVAGETVWGLTGRIIASLLEIGFGVHYDWYYRQASTKDS